MWGLNFGTRILGQSFIGDTIIVSEEKLTASTSAFLLLILAKESPTFFISRMNPAPLNAAVSDALGNCGGGDSQSLNNVIAIQWLALQQLSKAIS